MPENPESPDSVNPSAAKKPSTRSTAKPASRTAGTSASATKPTPAEKRAAAQKASNTGAARSTTAATAELPTNPPAAPAKRGFSLPVVAAIAVAALVGGASGAGVSLWAVSLNDDDAPATTSNPVTVTVNDPADASAITAVALKASASVVTISVAADSEGATGSGVVLSADGYILTNTHVVTLEGQSSEPDVKVETSDGRLLDATIVGTDPIADLAVIKADDVDDLVPVTFADSSKLNVGDTAIAIGASLGLSGTVTNGIVSSLNRSISIASAAVPGPEDEGDDDDRRDGDNPFDFWQFDEDKGSDTPNRSTGTIALAVIQTDAAINPGNSGGALLDAEGNLIGINVAIASAGRSSGQSGNIGVGFAIPSNLAKRVADEIIETGSATHGLLGASVLDVTEDEANADSATVGASILELTAGGAAEKAGLKVGDVITVFNGIPITGKTDLTAQVRALAAGATADLTYVRDGRSAEATVTLGELKL